jgi:hypothetical protein
MRRPVTPRFTATSRTFLSGLALLLAVGASSTASAQNRGNSNMRAYEQAIERVTQMPSDSDLTSRASSYGLNILNVLWEDTGRSAGSAFGPNISDVTLRLVGDGAPADAWSALLPVIRFPNFTDRTADVDMDSFFVRVGNESEGEPLRTVALRDVLSNLNQYLSNPSRGHGRLNLLAKRDSHVLVSAQHVFLPVPAQGEAQFVPTIFNYQSAPGNPAVLTLVVTREGMSAAAIENSPEDSAGGYGQSLYFNAAGERAPYSAERRSDVAARIESGNAQASDQGALDPGADVLLFIQIPLVHQNTGSLMGLGDIGGGFGEADYGSAMPSSPSEVQTRGASDVEVAVLGHGETEGPYRELNGQTIERDERFPIRVTVQFYRATSNGVVDADDMAAVAAQIERVYDEGDYVGSLVVPDGERNRPTDWIRTNPGGDTWNRGAFGWWMSDGK